MGALARATRAEIDGSDVEGLLGELLAGVSSRGPVAVKEMAISRGWAESELWRWLKGDGDRKAAYEEAKRYKSEMLVGEALEIAAGSGEAKLQVDTNFRFAEKAYPEVYGPRMKVEREVKVVEEGALLAGMVELLRLAGAAGAAGASRERVVAEQGPEQIETVDEI